ncbi:MAG: glycosyltransferase family A protein [Bacilli bacterium]|jgi:glycosyltransferase involved in cell wall biosynthesis
MKISVLTPTYNRAHTLPNLYRSLIKNKKYCNDIEWLIVDDGSNDETSNLVNGWIKEKKITIKYYKQSNQGKMAALNSSINHISGDITIECDSDDYFTDNCFKDVLNKWDTIKDDDSIYGLAFLKIKTNKELIGTKFNSEGQVLKVFDMYFKEGVEGDKFFVFKSKARKKFKHKLEHNECFATEGRMYHEMDLKYAGLKCFNIPGLVCEYLEDGYTHNILDIFKKYPYGHYYYYLEMFNFNMRDIPFKKRLHIIKHYILFSCLTKKKKRDVIKKAKGFLNKILITVLVIPGFIATNKKFK